MKIYAILFLLFLPLISSSQKEGQITFDETVKLNLKIPAGMEEVFAKIPKERTVEKVLYFRGSESIYTKVPDNIGDEDDNVSMSNGGFQLEFRMEEPDNKTYIDQDAKEVRRQQDLMGKTFLIEDKVPVYNWKIGKEMRKILDYVCVNAQAEVNDSTSLVAWFSSQIPVSIGPQEYQGLPGAILALEFNGDERIFVATEVKLGSIDPQVIEIPKKGKKVSREEFDKIQDEKMKELNAERGSGGVHIITRNN